MSLLNGKAMNEGPRSPSGDHRICTFITGPECKGQGAKQFQRTDSWHLWNLGICCLALPHIRTSVPCSSATRVPFCPSVVQHRKQILAASVWCHLCHLQSTQVPGSWPPPRFQRMELPRIVAFQPQLKRTTGVCPNRKLPWDYAPKLWEWHCHLRRFRRQNSEPKKIILQP